jgi:alpha-tubulin suppressor-like RCC1 family protein
MFLTSDGRVYAYEYKQLDILEFPNNIVQIIRNEMHALFLNSNGNVYGFGDNKYSRLGLSDEGYNTPTLIG